VRENYSYATGRPKKSHTDRLTPVKIMSEFQANIRPKESVNQLSCDPLQMGDVWRIRTWSSTANQMRLFDPDIIHGLTKT